MSRRQDLPSPLIVRRWTTEEVLRTLQQNGLGDAVQPFRKRNIDGNAFLRLTELQLSADWHPELSFSSIRKIVKLLDDIKSQSEKPLQLSKPTKPFDPRFPNKQNESPKPKLKPTPPPAHWKNQCKNTAPIAPVFGSRSDKAPLLPSRREPVLVPSIFGNKRDHSPAPLQPSFGNRPDPSPVPLPSAFGNRPNPSPVPLPPAFGNRPDPSPVPLPPAFGNRPDPSPVPLPSAFGNRPDPSPVPLPSAFGNRPDPSPVIIPPASGNWRGSNPIATSTSHGVSSSARFPQPVTQKAGRPPVPLNKPQLQPTSGKNDVGCPNAEEDGSLELGSVLQRQLANAFRARSQSLASQQNGWSSSKPAEATVRPTLKTPVAVRYPPQKTAMPVAYLPVPPPMTTEQEDEHMKEIVSSIQIPSAPPPNVDEIIDGNNELYLNTTEENGEEIYEEPDLEALAAEQAEFQPGGDVEADSDEWGSDIYEYIPESVNSGEYYIQPTGTVCSSSAMEFESTHDQVEELPVAPAIPARPQVVQPSFFSSLKSSIFRSSETKSSETQSSKENNLLTKPEKPEEEPRKSSLFRSISPGREKLTVSSELRKSPSSSTTSLTIPIKGNAGQAGSLPDQRLPPSLPPSLRPLPPTPAISSFRSGPSNNTATVSRKTSNSKTGITLNQQPWYHNVNRSRAEEIVCNREDGTFLIRPSTQNLNPYALTIWYGNRVYNIAIRIRSDQKFALGFEKPKEQSFWSLEDMVAFYQTEQLILYSGGEKTGLTSLKSSP